MLRLFGLLLLLATPAHAREIIPPSEFEELSTGKTLYFSFEGTPFGAEQFFTGRRSLWQHSDGSCSAGAWHDNGDMMCFLYEDNLDLQCWYTYRRDGEIYVQSENARIGEELKLERMDRVPLPCIGPDLGV